MYKVYIKNYKSGNSIIDTENVMFEVPDMGGFPVSKPIVKASEDSAENFTFTMDCNSPFYDALLQHKTRIRVIYNGPNNTDTDVIFDGKVLNISTSTVYHTKNVTCAGYYVYFNDSYYEGKQEKHRNKMTVSQYYDNIIANHNAMVPDKAVTKGSIGVELPSEEDKYEPTAWTQTSGLLSNLTSNHGGHMLVHSSENTHTLNWYKYYARDLGDGLRPKVTVTKNILDISAEYTGDNVFTRVIPIGDTNNDGKTVYIDGYKYDGTNTYSGKAMPVSFIRNLYTDQELTDEFHHYTDYRDAETNFGVIYKTVTFADADTQVKLWNYVKKWIKDSYFGIQTSFTVKAIDMHIIDNNYPKILIGECVDVTYLIVRNGVSVWETKKLVCTNVSYDLFNPENNSYTFSIPSDMLDHSRTNKKSSKSSKNTQTVSAATSSKANPRKAEDETITWRKVWQMIGTLQGDPDYEGTAAALSFYKNGELSGTVYCIDPTEITTGEAAELNQKKFEAHLIGKITLPGKSVKWVAISSARGIFAYTENRYIKSVSHWYDKKSGYKYDESSEPAISSSETIADIIEKDTDPSWGGTTAAASFRANGKISGSVNRAYDPDKCTAQQAAADPKLVFSADIAGKFTLNGTTKYVAISKEYGIFGYNASARGIIPATHWYMQTKGISYDNVSGFVAMANDGKIYATNDGNADSTKTFMLEPTVLTGYGSQGEMKIGYDITGSADTWRIELNTPIQYTDEDGVTRIADGFVSASDFAVSTIPSFKTKIGIFDIVIASKVSAQTISADLAEVRKWLNATSITAGTWIRTDKLYANKIYSYQDIYLNSGGNYHYQYQLSNSTMRNLDDCLYDVSCSESEGVITITCSRLNGSTAASDSFNMAATTFYQNKVAAARTSGRNDVYVNNISIQAGSSGTYHLHYTDPSTGHEMNTGATFTVTASGGGGGAPTVDLNGAGPSYTQYDSPPTTPMRKSGGVIIGHIWYRIEETGKWAYLRQFSISYPTS